MWTVPIVARIIGSANVGNFLEMIDDRSSVLVIDRPRLGSAFPSETFKHPPSLQWTHALTLANAFATRGQNLL